MRSSAEQVVMVIKNDEMNVREENRSVHVENVVIMKSEMRSMRGSEAIWIGLRARRRGRNNAVGKTLVSRIVPISTNGGITHDSNWENNDPYKAGRSTQTRS